MPSKTKKKDAAASKKAEQKKKQKVIEDKTFGLKNKNKSKKVQQHIESVTKTVMNSGDRRQRAMEEQRKQQKAAMKAKKKAEKEEQDALFGDALLNIKKKTTTNMKDGKNEAKGRDADEENTKKGTSRAMKMMYQMDAQEMEAKLKEDVSENKIYWRHSWEYHQAHFIVRFSRTMFQLWKIKLRQNDRRKLRNSRKAGRELLSILRHSQHGKRRKGKSERKRPKSWWKRKCERRRVAKVWLFFLEEICSSISRSCSMLTT